jgi:hypothetical protein
VLTLPGRDYLTVPLRVARELINADCPALACVQVRCYWRLRRRRLLPREARAAGRLDYAALLLEITADLVRQGKEELADGTFRAAGRALDEAARVLAGEAADYAASEGEGREGGDS